MADRGSARAKAVDVARHAGVSTATVSLVINGKAEGRVSAATRQRVERAIDELDYQVNPAARSLVTGRRQCIALVASDVSNPFISSVAAGVASELGDDYQLLLVVSGKERSLPDLRRTLGFGVDGVLLDLPMADQLRTLAPQLPIVALDDPGAPSDVARVSFGVRRAASELASHLAGLGHRSVIYVDAPRPWATFKSRRSAFARALRRAATGASISTVRCDIEIDAARTLVMERWAEWRRAGATALVGASDVLAYGAVEAFAALGVNVPADVSLASFDGLPYATITDPPLTTAVLPAFELGTHGARLMLELIGHAGSANGPTVTSVELDAQLVIRGSTGPAASPRRRT